MQGQYREWSMTAKVKFSVFAGSSIYWPSGMELSLTIMPYAQINLSFTFDMYLHLSYENREVKESRPNLLEEYQIVTGSSDDILYCPL